MKRIVIMLLCLFLATNILGCTDTDEKISGIKVLSAILTNNFEKLRLNEAIGEFGIIYKFIIKNESDEKKNFSVQCNFENIIDTEVQSKVLYGINKMTKSLVLSLKAGEQKYFDLAFIGRTVSDNKYAEIKKNTEPIFEIISPVKEQTCGDYKFEPIDAENAMINKYTGNKTSIKIPNKINGFNVLGIKNFNNDNITEISFEEGIKVIDNSLNGCKLKKINLPQSLQSIYRKSLSDCSELTSINIPENVKDINVFDDYEDENYVTYAPFPYCHSLKSITVDKNNKYYFSVEGVLYGKSDMLLRCPELKKGEVILPDNITGVWYYDDLKQSAFENCSKITKVKFSKAFWDINIIPKKLVKNYLFVNCNKKLVFE